MKHIQLSKKGSKHKGKYFAIVDDEDYDMLNKFNWHVYVSTKHNISYAVRTGDKESLFTKVSMHTHIMNTKKGMNIDHINHNGLDNRRINLREVTQSVNIQNGRKCISKTSKYKGVSKDEYIKNGIKYQYWRALIYIINPSTLKKKKISLGLLPYTIEGEIMAAELYNNAAIKYYGSKCYLNCLPNNNPPTK